MSDALEAGDSLTPVEGGESPKEIMDGLQYEMPLETNATETELKEEDIYSDEIYKKIEAELPNTPEGILRVVRDRMLPGEPPTEALRRIKEEDAKDAKEDRGSGFSNR